VFDDFFFYYKNKVLNYVAINWYSSKLSSYKFRRMKQCAIVIWLSQNFLFDCCFERSSRNKWVGRWLDTFSDRTGWMFKL